MSFPRDWFKYDQPTLDLASAEQDVILGVTPLGAEAAYPEDISLLVPSGEMMWTDAFKLSKKLFALREALRAALTGERRAAFPPPKELAQFVSKVVLIRPGRPEKGMGAVTPGFLIIAGPESPYRATMKGLQLFINSPQYAAMQEVKRIKAAQAAGLPLTQAAETASAPTEPPSQPSAWDGTGEEAKKLWEEVGKGPTGEG